MIHPLDSNLERSGKRKDGSPRNPAVRLEGKLYFLFCFCFRELKLPEIILKASVRILLIRFIDKESARRILQKRRHRTSVMRLLNYDRYAGMSARRQWEALIVGIVVQQESESGKKK